MKQLQQRFFYHELGFAILAFTLGTLLHFAYEFFGSSPIVGLFAPVNESTWEHLKLLFFPVLLLTVIEYFLIGQSFSFFVPARTIGVAAGLIFIVAFFYTYTGIIGRNYLWLDILTFLLSVLITYAITFFLSIKIKTESMVPVFISLCFLFLLTILFFYFTNHQPDINLFKAMPSNIQKA